MRSAFVTAALTLMMSSAVFAHKPQTLSTTQTDRLILKRSQCARGLHCILAHEATEGPYYIPEPLLRSNITEDRDGVPLNLRVTVVDVATCAPAEGVWVDIWHADASGEYSGWAKGDLLGATAEAVSVGSSGLVRRQGGPPFSSHGPQGHSRWLRGVAMADAQGLVEFDTVMPAWYHGRTTHIHIRIHSGNVTVEDGQLLGAGQIAHTGQLFFADELVTELSETRSPYTELAKTLKPILNGDDGIYLHSEGAEQVVSIEKDANVFVGSITVGIDMKADHQEDEHGGFGKPGHWWKAVVGTLIVCAVVVTAAYWLRSYRRRRAARRSYVVLEADEPATLSGLNEPRAIYHDQE